MPMQILETSQWFIILMQYNNRYLDRGGWTAQVVEKKCDLHVSTLNGSLEALLTK